MNYLLDGEESERLNFRKIDLNDFNIWLEFHKDPSARKYWLADFQTPEIECEKWYNRQFYRHENKLGGLNALVTKDGSRLIGHCGLLVQTVDQVKELEIGYSILPEFWNKGYATEASQKCRDYAFQNDLAQHLISIISLTNKPSEKVAQKNGMKVYKTTMYNSNKVNIFKITKKDWENVPSK